MKEEIKEVSESLINVFRGALPATYGGFIVVLGIDDDIGLVPSFLFLLVLLLFFVLFDLAFVRLSRRLD